MELSSAQRKIAFAVIVLVLAGLGYSLFMPKAASTANLRSSRPGPSAPASSAPASSAPAVSPAGLAGQPSLPAPSGGPAPDIYQWLPFTQAELGTATRTVISFADSYGTYSYTQNAAGYLAPMRALITAQLGQLLEQAYATPGVAGVRVRDKQVSAGTAAIISLRAFGSGSLTFVVAITQRITATGGPSRSTVNYAVTATGGGASWQVSDIELASAGNS